MPDRIDTTLPGTFNVGVVVNGAADAVSAPVQVQFDPKVLRLNDVSPGDFFTQGGSQPVVAKNIQNDSGSATVSVSRPPGSPGVSGTGVILTLSFQAVGRGNTVVTLPNVSVRNSQNQVIGGGAPGLPVRVQ